jgi:hypothetical protein
MANTYSWGIAQLQCYPEKDGKKNVVFMCNWTRTAVGPKGVSASLYGAQEITLNPSDPFTPYANLTLAQVCGWLEANMGAEAIAVIDNTLDNEISAKVTPQEIAPPLPWA